MIRPPPRSPLFPYTTLSRSVALLARVEQQDAVPVADQHPRLIWTSRTREKHDGGDSSRSGADADPPRDRKSTRLNSSHLVISYAVFCLKKKKRIHTSCDTEI